MNNKDTVKKIQIRFSLTILLLIIAWICSLTIKVLEEPFLQWGAGIGAALSLIYYWWGGFYFLAINLVEDQLEIKFYNSFPFAREFKMFRIPKIAFLRYEINDSFLGLHKKLFLYQLSSNQMAKYPAIYLGAFDRVDLKKLKDFFADLK